MPEPVTTQAEFSAAVAAVEACKWCGGKDPADWVCTEHVPAGEQVEVHRACPDCDGRPPAIHIGALTERVSLEDIRVPGELCDEGCGERVQYFPYDALCECACCESPEPCDRAVPKHRLVIHRVPGCGDQPTRECADGVTLRGEKCEQCARGHQRHLEAQADELGIEHEPAGGSE